METNVKNRILVVDDDLPNLEVLGQILSPYYAILIAKSGEEVLDRVIRDRPDLILLDILLAGMGGFDVLVRLKEFPETKNIPVIIITGLSNDDDEEKGFSLGAVDYITKPFKNAIVLARVRTHIQIVQQIRTIERMGLMDPLTDIPNRRCFDEHFDREWRRSIREQKPISFLMMDLDKFKNYNDTYGHPQGDVLLKTVAKIFCAEAKRSADLAARIGGEEFGVILPDTDLESALIVAEKIRSNVEAARAPTIDGEMTSITISIGVNSIIPGRTDLSADFISKADEYLYEAKNTGRNKICSGT
jgi:diguanylate cyclase (GGDEF)-like protein